MKNRYMKWLCALMAAMLLIMGGLVGASAAESIPGDGRVFLGGMPFGVKFSTQGVMVVGFCDVEDAVGQQGQGVNPAKTAGIKLKDVITHVNGTPLAGAEDLTRAVESCGGRPLTLTLRRPTLKSVGTAKNAKDRGSATGSEELIVRVTPVKSQGEGKYKTGLWIRDSGAGIGTVTFILPATNAFGGLGHGICDGDTGELIPMQRGAVTDVTISGIDRGAAGAPGAIKGYFAANKTGTLLGNTECGVYGIYATRPASATEKLPLAAKGEIREGEATLYCTLDDGGPRPYRVMISRIDGTAKGSKCFTVTVTDPGLIAKTGGIVQGMSGSPLVQNGKLIGAVTHVLVGDPTTGYGIFIENMLNAAQMPMAKAS